LVFVDAKAAAILFTRFAGILMPLEKLMFCVGSVRRAKYYFLNFCAAIELI
jgi:hypothetical protein